MNKKRHKHIIGYNIGGYGTVSFVRLGERHTQSFPEKVFKYCPICGKKIINLKRFVKLALLFQEIRKQTGNQSEYAE